MATLDLKESVDLTPRSFGKEFNSLPPSCVTSPSQPRRNQEAVTQAHASNTSSGTSSMSLMTSSSSGVSCSSYWINSSDTSLSTSSPWQPLFSRSPGRGGRNSGCHGNADVKLPVEDAATPEEDEGPSPTPAYCGYPGDESDNTCVKTRGRTEVTEEADDVIPTLSRLDLPSDVCINKRHNTPTDVRPIDKRHVGVRHDARVPNVSMDDVRSGRRAIPGAGSDKFSLGGLGLSMPEPTLPVQVVTSSSDVTKDVCPGTRKRFHYKKKSENMKKEGPVLQSAGTQTSVRTALTPVPRPSLPPLLPPVPRMRKEREPRPGGYSSQKPRTPPPPPDRMYTSTDSSSSQGSVLSVRKGDSGGDKTVGDEGISSKPWHHVWYHPDILLGLADCKEEESGIYSLGSDGSGHSYNTRLSAARRAGRGGSVDQGREGVSLPAGRAAPPEDSLLPGTGESPVTCPICDGVFKNKRGVNIHISKKHRGKSQE